MFLTVPAALVESALHCGGHAHEDAGAGLPVAGVARRCGRTVNRACRFASRVPCSVGRRKKPLHRRMPERRQIDGVRRGRGEWRGCDRWRMWRMAAVANGAVAPCCVGGNGNWAASPEGQLRRSTQAISPDGQLRRSARSPRHHRDTHQDWRAGGQSLRQGCRSTEEPAQEIPS